jgi:hypothetical protein
VQKLKIYLEHSVLIDFALQLSSSSGQRQQLALKIRRATWPSHESIRHLVLLPSLLTGSWLVHVHHTRWHSVAQAVTQRSSGGGSLELGGGTVAQLGRAWGSVQEWESGRGR